MHWQIIFVYRVFCLQIVSLVCFYEITFSVTLNVSEIKVLQKVILYFGLQVLKCVFFFILNTLMAET